MLRLKGWKRVQVCEVFFYVLLKLDPLIIFINNWTSKLPIYLFLTKFCKKCNFLCDTFTSIFSIFRVSSPECPALCLLLQLMWARVLLHGQNGLLKGMLHFKPLIVFFKPESVKTILTNPDLIDKSEEYRLLSPWIGTGLITSGGKKWQKHRKLLTPTFHFAILDNFLPIVQEHSNILVSKLRSRIHEPWIDALPLLCSCTLDVICETAMGVSIKAQCNEDSEYTKAVLELENTIMHRAVRPWLYPDVIFNLTKLGKEFKTNLELVHRLNEKILREKKLEMTNGVNLSSETENKMVGNSYRRRKPFLEFLLEHHFKDSSFTEQDIRDEVNTFMLAGNDTTSITVNFVLFCLGVYQEIQKAVHEELDAIFQSEDDGYVSRESLTKMKYLECVIKETMRLYPTVPFVLRDNKQPFKVSRHTVNPGTMCIIFILALHRDPESFPEPERFDPDRFLPENVVSRHPYSYIPFSAGPRNCIGQRFAMMEAKIILASVLKHFRVISLDSRDKVLLMPNILTKTVKPLRLRFELR